MAEPFCPTRSIPHEDKHVDALLHTHPGSRHTPTQQLSLAMTGQGPMMMLLGGWIQGRVPGRPQKWTWGYLGWLVPGCGSTVWK